MSADLPPDPAVSLDRIARYLQVIAACKVEEWSGSITPCEATSMRDLLGEPL